LAISFVLAQVLFHWHCTDQSDESNYHYDGNKMALRRDVVWATKAIVSRTDGIPKDLGNIYTPMPGCFASVDIQTIIQ
jgi:hypothetical protein